MYLFFNIYIQLYIDICINWLCAFMLIPCLVLGDQQERRAGARFPAWSCGALYIQNDQTIFFKDPVISRLWLIRKSSKQQFYMRWCARDAPCPSLGCGGGLRYKADYSLRGITSKRGWSADPPARDQQCDVSLISANKAWIVLRASLIIIAFHWFHKHQSVSTARVCPRLSPGSTAWANQASVLLSSFHLDGLNASQELHNATSSQTWREKGHSKNSCWDVSKFLS